MSAERFEVVANARSGAASRLGREGLETMIRETLGGRLARVSVVEPDEIDAAMRRAFRSDADAVCVVGGDGTCRMAAELAHEADRTVALLPGGTMNLLPARLWGGRGLRAGLEALGAGDVVEVRLDAGEVNGRLFLVAAAFGAAPAITRLREGFRSAGGPVEVAHLLGRLVGVTRRLVSPTVRMVTADGRRLSCPALAFTPGDADRALARAGADVVDVDAADGLECVAATVDGAFDLARVLTRAFLDDHWRRDRKVTTTVVQAARVAGRRSRIALTLDGEAIEVANPAEVRFLPGAVRALSIRRDDPAAAEGPGGGLA